MNSVEERRRAQEQELGGPAGASSTPAEPLVPLTKEACLALFRKTGTRMPILPARYGGCTGGQRTWGARSSISISTLIRMILVSLMPTADFGFASALLVFFDFWYSGCSCSYASLACCCGSDLVELDLVAAHGTGCGWVLRVVCGDSPPPSLSAPL